MLLMGGGVYQLSDGQAKDGLLVSCVLESVHDPPHFTPDFICLLWNKAVKDVERNTCLQESKMNHFSYY